jgi:hypothetical protein
MTLQMRRLGVQLARPYGVSIDDAMIATGAAEGRGMLSPAPADAYKLF